MKGEKSKMNIIIHIGSLDVAMDPYGKLNPLIQEGKSGAEKALAIAQETLEKGYFENQYRKNELLREIVAACEVIGDEERIKKAYAALAEHTAENCIGYSDEVDEKVAGYYEKAEDYEKAIFYLREATRHYEASDGFNDLHGDPRPGKEDAMRVLKEVGQLERKMYTEKEKR